MSMDDEDDFAKSHVESLLEPLEKEKKRQYSFYIDVQVYKAFMMICKKHGLSGSKVVNAALKDFIAKYGRR
jgi:hypothetical protein